MGFAVLMVFAIAAVVIPTLTGRVAIATAALLVMLLSRLSDVGVAFHGWPSVAQPVVVLLGGVVFVWRTRTGGSRSLSACRVFYSAALVYLAIVAASSIWATDGGAAIAQASDLAKNLLIVYILAETLATRRAQRVAVWTVVVTGSCLAGLSIVQALSHTFGDHFLGFAQAHVQQIVGTESGYRSAGPIGDANFYGLVLASMVPLAVARIRDEVRVAARVAAAVCVGLLVGGVVLTYSRGALVALSVGVVIMVPMLRVPARLVVVAAAIALAGFFTVLPTQYRERALNAATTDHSLAGHTDSQWVALDLFSSHPLLGVGADNYRSAYQHAALALHRVDAASTVHDVYLAVLSETGLLGLAALLTALSSVVGRSLRRRALERRAGDVIGEGLLTSTCVALIVYAVGCLFLPLAYPRYLWIFAGLALAVTLPEGAPPRVRRTRVERAVST